MIQRGNYYVVAKCGNLNVVSCYISPNITRGEALEALDEMNGIIQELDGQTIIGGDFNAKSAHWGSPVTNSRGDLVDEWAAELDLRLANIGSSPTCVRSQGSSIVDLTWTSPGIIQSVDGWHVDLDAETLSDHMYIQFKIDLDAPMIRRKNQPRKLNRWNFSKMDIEAFNVALNWACAEGSTQTDMLSAEGKQKWLSRVMRHACNKAATRCRSGLVKQKDCYWLGMRISLSYGQDAYRLEEDGCAVNEGRRLKTCRG